jgi:Flagellar protein FliT
MSVWHDLEALVHEESRLVAGGRFDELAALNARRGTLLAALPRPLPPEALEPLSRALAMQRATTTAMEARRDAIGAELASLRHRRTGVRGYARTFDVQP